MATMLTRQTRSPVTLIVVSFLSICTLGLMLNWLTRDTIKQHYPTKLCSGAPAVILVVRTAPSRYGNREVIRKSIGHQSVRDVLSWRVLFYMGYTQDPRRAHYLKNELKKGDILLLPREASPSNIVRIFADAARWIANECSSGVRYLIHVNDTTFADFVGLYMYITSLPDTDKRIHCAKRQAGDPVDRNPENRGSYVPVSVQKEDTFPVHCAGEVFLVSSASFKLLAQGLEKALMFGLFGPFVTGTVPALVGLEHTCIANRFRVLEEEDDHKGERKLFVTGLRRVALWKKVWLQSLVCYPEVNGTLPLTDGIISKIQISLLN